MNRTIPEFLSMALPHVLPVLFSQKDLATLDLLSKEASKSKVGMFLSASSDILGCIFLLKNQEDRNSALSFLLGVLGESVTKTNVGLPNIIRSCTIPLLANLVVKMGSFDEEMSQDVRN